MKTLAALLLAVSLNAVAADATPPAVVRFNTVCANCHEGECSGRLSFNSGASAARGHMQRYLGNIAEAEVETLFALLRQLKEQCRQAPVDVTPPPDGCWSAEVLRPWRNVQQGGYFIPLGTLSAGRHEARITFVTAGQGRLKITNERFDLVAEEFLGPEETLALNFVAQHGAHFLTVTGPVEIGELQLLPAKR